MKFYVVLLFVLLSIKSFAQDNLHLTDIISSVTLEIKKLEDFIQNNGTRDVTYDKLAKTTDQIRFARSVAVFLILEDKENVEEKVFVILTKSDVLIDSILELNRYLNNKSPWNKTAKLKFNNILEQLDSLRKLYSFDGSFIYKI